MVHIDPNLPLQEQPCPRCAQYKEKLERPVDLLEEDLGFSTYWDGERKAGLVLGNGERYPRVSKQEFDPVEHPEHYTSKGVECIDWIRHAQGNYEFLGYLKGNILKYLWRYEGKGAPVQDLKKARWYLDKLIEEAELLYPEKTPC